MTSRSLPTPTDTASPARRRFRTVVAAGVAIAVVAILGIGFPVVTGDAPGGAAVDSCARIDDPGRYVLTSDLSNATSENCLVIAASNVTLNGGGHVVDGVDADPDSVGVLVGGSDTPQPADVTVRNLSVTGFGDGVAIDAGGGTVRAIGLHVEDVRGTGLSVEADAKAVVESVRVANASGDGIALDVDGNLSVANVTVTDTGRYGLYAQGRGSTMVFADVRVERSSQEAFEVLGAANVTVDGLTVSTVRGDEFPELYDGVFVDVDGDVGIENATVRAVPEGRGIYVYAGTDDATVRLTDATVEGTRGVAVSAGSYGESTLAVTDVVAVGVDGALTTQGFRSVQVRGFVARDVDGTGIRIGGSEALVDTVTVANASGRDVVFSATTGSLRNVRLDGTRLGGQAEDVVVDARSVGAPDGFGIAGGPVAVRFPGNGGSLDASIHYETAVDDATVGVYGRVGSEWSPVAGASVDRNRDVASATVRTNATVAVLVELSADALAPYANESGIVTDSGLSRAIDDWVAGEIPDGLLSRAIRAWVRGTPVGSGD